MIGSEQLSTYLPVNRVHNLARLKPLAIKEFFICDKIGMLSLAQKDDRDSSCLYFRISIAGQGFRI